MSQVTRAGARHRWSKAGGREAGQATTGVDERVHEVRIRLTRFRIQLINHAYEIKLHFSETRPGVHRETSLLAGHRAQQGTTTVETTCLCRHKDLTDSNFLPHQGVQSVAGCG